MFGLGFGGLIPNGFWRVKGWVGVAWCGGGAHSVHSRLKPFNLQVADRPEMFGVVREQGDDGS